MHPDCLQHCLTPEESATFNEQGFLVVENAIDPMMLRQVIDAVDAIDATERDPVNGADKLLSVTNVLHRSHTFFELLDWPTVFPKVWGALGWNIYCYHSHLDVTPPARRETAAWDVAWHQDSMRVNDEIETHPRPRLSLKVGFYLTDVSEPGRGNTLVVPGSHLQDEIQLPQDGFSSPGGAEPLCVRAGTAVLLDRRVWHSRSLNTSDFTRKVLWLGYSYRWMRPKDEMTVEHFLADAAPVRRQLLGSGSANSAYDPQDADVPLRVWLQEHCPDDAAWSRHARPHARPPAMVRGTNLGRQ
ncbi:MAG: phytanoyl-CoA dioxygenase family protein [Planctomycetota bacterium]|jgi:ectoine hydroxylase-related dioxygenase (phytanoyl-CoA dioxygenase family)